MARVSRKARRNEADSVQLGLRIKESLRKKIEQAAASGGCSMNEEAAFRIKQSFLDEENLYKNQALMALVQLLIGTIRLIETRTGKEWTHDDRTRNAVTATIIAFITGEDGVPFHKDAKSDGEGGWRHEFAGLKEGNREALADAMWALLKAHGSSDQTIEMIERLIRTDEESRRVGGGGGLVPEG
jgi:hypothetical protein